MNHQLTDFIDDLKSTHRGNLVSVILYGSSAIGNRDSYSDYNLLVVLEKIGPVDLRNAHGAIREWARIGHNVPVYFTASEIANAADVFPIEFQQMKRARKVIYGRDVLADVELSNENLRHQVEFELRSKLILLRRQYIPASTTVEDLLALMADSLASFIAIFRGVLMLIEVNAPAGRHETLAITVERLGLNGRPFERIFNIRKDNVDHPVDEVEANELFAEYMQEIERVIETVDALDSASVG
jgi:predicted nucleotidyltransferase